MKLGFLSVAVTVLLVVSGCTQQSPQSKLDVLKAEIRAKYLEPEWSVGCQQQQYDAYGEKVGYNGGYSGEKKCWVYVTDYETSNLGANMRVTKIFEVNNRGARFVTPDKLDADTCDHPAPRKQAIDGKRIDTLSHSKKVALLKTGKRFTRESNRGWPYCNINNQTTRLSGGFEAYSEMMRQWKAL